MFQLPWVAATEQPDHWHCHWLLQLSRLVRITPSKFKCQDKHWSLEFLRLFLLVFNSHNSRFWAKRLFSDPLNIIPFKYVKVIFSNSRNKMLFFFETKIFSWSCMAAMKCIWKKSAWGKAYLTFKPKNAQSHHATLHLKVYFWPVFADQSRTKNWDTNAPNSGKTKNRSTVDWHVPTSPSEIQAPRA